MKRVRKPKPVIEIPLELFRSLVSLQAHYASLLNLYDQADRRPVRLSRKLLASLDEHTLNIWKRVSDEQNR